MGGDEKMGVSVLEEKIRFTYEDYLSLPNDGKRYQVVEGEIYMVPAPAPYHQDIVGNLFVLLRTFVEERWLGRVYFAPCDVILSEEDIVPPDILFILKEREHIITKRNIRGAPDLVIEIVSPFTAKFDKTAKMKLYEKFGVKEYWLVDPDAKKIEVLTRNNGSYESEGVFGIEQSWDSPLLKGYGSV
jgi:Uma2 family endonuclease